MATKQMYSTDVGSISRITSGTYSFTKTYADFSASALTNDVEILSLPAGLKINDVYALVTTLFSGGTIATYTISVGIGGAVTKYMLANSVATAGGLTSAATKGTALTTAGTTNVESFTGATSIRAYATTTVANLDQATQGSITFYIDYSGVVV